MEKTVALALGSGGARGYTHIGVIDALEARGYRIVKISGCSMGAIVGGFYCAGKLQEYRDWVTTLNYLDVIKLLDISLLSGGMIRGNKIFSIVEELLGDLNIEDLEIPFTAVATDLTNHKEVWFQRGPLSDAVRASAAIPTLLAPVSYNGRILVDGAVLNPLPITPCVSSYADTIIAVDLHGEVPMPMDLLHQVNNSVEAEVKDKQPWFRNFLSHASRFLEKNKKEDNVEVEAGFGKLEIMTKVIDVMSSSLTQYKIAGYPPDLLIKMPANCCETYEFYRAEELIQLGRRIADEALDAFEAGQSSVYGQRLS